MKTVYPVLSILIAFVSLVLLVINTFVRCRGVPFARFLPVTLDFRSNFGCSIFTREKCENSPHWPFSDDLFSSTHDVMRVELFGERQAVVKRLTIKAVDASWDFLLHLFALRNHKFS
jgi:hypothetical protein